jgi:hypothetical protein
MKRIKKKFAYAAGLLLVACSFTACEMLGDNCEICQLVTYDNGYPSYTGPESEFCGDELLKIKTKPPETSGTVTIQWECN